jgi:hypothetical protein
MGERAAGGRRRWIAWVIGVLVAVFHDDGSAEFDHIPDMSVWSGRGEWNLIDVQGPTVIVRVGTTGFNLYSKWDNFRSVLVSYSGDPDDPRSEHVFTHG